MVPPPPLSRGRVPVSVPTVIRISEWSFTSFEQRKNVGAGAGLFPDTFCYSKALIMSL